MESTSTFVYLQKHPTDLYPSRVLQYKNVYIDETCAIVSPPSSNAICAYKFEINVQNNTTEFNTLLESYNKYMEAKNAYESAANDFWKSELGKTFEKCLKPDPPIQDRSLIHLEIKKFEEYLELKSIEIKSKYVDISGYNYTKLRYVAIMYETQDPPTNIHGFSLQTWYFSRNIIPSVWSNKKNESKKEVELFYIYGNILPPYKVSDLCILQHRDHSK